MISRRILLFLLPSAVLIGSALELATSVTAQEPNQQLPNKLVGKWVGVSGTMKAESVHGVGTAIVREDFGHTIDQFEFEVARDGTVKGSGKATFYFNVYADANLLAARVAPSAQLDGKTQQVEFTISGKMTPDGKLTVLAEPKNKLTLINAGQKTTMSGWNVLGPFEEKVNMSEPRPVITASHVISEHNINLEWKARRDTSIVNFYVDAFIPWKRIPAPPLLGTGFDELNGNDRDFEKGGYSKLSTSVTVDLDPSAANPRVGRPEEKIGPSEGYYKEMVNGELLEITEKAQASGQWDGEHGMNTTVYKEGSKVHIDIDANVSIPFKAGIEPVKVNPPAIQYHYEIVAWRTGNEMFYTIKGTHKSFPAYSIYVNDEQVHKFKPNNPKDDSEAALGLYRDLPVDLKGQIK